MKPLLLFDGYCLLCQASVHFILKYERDDSLQFAPLHAEISQKILSEHGLDSNYVDSLVFYNGKDCLVKSDAALMAASYLKLPWSILKYLSVLPKFLRDLARIQEAHSDILKWTKVTLDMMPPSKQHHSSPGSPCRYKKPNYRHSLNLAHVQKGFFGRFLHEAEQTVTSHLSHI